jgi:4-amino-4-deoxy-L-arabinose transferase-like glycosyltransferase
MVWLKHVRHRTVWLAAVLLLLALGFRLFVALRLPNDTPGDGVVYAQIARNVLEQHVYSHDEQPPFAPSLIRLPGYPFFLAAIYAITGHGNNTAVRVVQAIIDTSTCALVALVAFQWTEDKKRKEVAAIAALTLAAVCPFTTIYVATILTEVPTSFLAVLLCLVSTLAFKAPDSRRAIPLWIAAGLIAGLAVFFRPDSGLFAAAVGFTILLSSLAITRDRKSVIQRFWKSIIVAAVFSFAFCLILVPWTIRNHRVFGVFQPLSPAHGEMPGEFVPRGYLMWLRTWLDDGRYIGPVLWQLDTTAIHMNAFPKRAFDSPDERQRVSALIDKYNGQPPTTARGESGTAVPAASPSASPNAQAEQSSGADEEESDEEGSEDENSDQPDSGVEMTPEIDAGFGQIARERIARAPFRYYVVLPVKRAGSLWFDTHSTYYPFDGELFPLEDLDYDIHQQYWLPLFAGLTWVYTILGVMGAWMLWRTRSAASRRWLLLAALIIFLRLGFFSTLENPEPRYTVELFPFLSILGGVGIAYLRSAFALLARVLE